MSDSNRFQRLEALFHELQDMEPGNRRQRLEALADEDPGLHAELLDLLEPSDTQLRDEQALDSVAGRGGLAASLGGGPRDPEQGGP
ncbi:MAG: hypothetical protein V2J10_02560, partial [Wenzhouxiangella sp.]|nr:hypothetical protein [Wenzhouxiangella sp.]